jgi:hypothetical protein
VAAEKAAAEKLVAEQAAAAQAAPKTAPAISASGATRQVTSWAEKGVTPDLNPGRWVQIGGPTWWNYIKTGLWGGKYEFGFSKSFPWIIKKIPTNPVPFSNYITSFVEQTRLLWPKELGWIPDTIKGLLGQRKLK